MKIFKPQEIDPAWSKEETLRRFEEYLRWAASKRGLPDMIVSHLLHNARVNGLPDDYQVPKIPAPKSKP